MKQIYLLTIALLLTGGVFAQKDLTYTPKEIAYMEDQTRHAYTLIDSMLLSHPPKVGIDMERCMAMMGMDLIVHDKINDNTPPLYEFINRRIARVVDELAKPVTHGMRIFKLYNDSFIAKTASTTIAFDLIPGGAPTITPYIADSLIRRLVKMCDILFISHEHGDHASREVARLFSAEKKIIFTPKGVWEGLSPNIRSVRTEEVADYTVNLSGNRILKIRILPGHQAHILNNINHVVTPEGISIMHSGDQYGTTDLPWLAKVHEHTRTDVLLVNCWATSPEILIPGIAPKLVIPGHENELWHDLTHREAHWETWGRMEGIAHPMVFMTWGEWFDYLPAKN